ncbi:MAG: AmmeMemoRadiSam system protein B, partial [bacterium]
MIPQKPKIRPLEAFPLSNSDKYPIGLRDPTHQAGSILAVTPGTLLLISLMNGERDLKAIQEEFVRRTKTLVTSEDMERLVYTLDQYYFLDSPRFHKYQRFLREEFTRSPVRAMFHAHFLGQTVEEIDQFFTRYFDTHEEHFPFTPRGVICPHIDYQRGKKAYNAIFPRLPEWDSSTTVLFLGVAHFEEKEQPFYATLKDFETPFGIVPVAKDAVEIIAESANYPIFDGEFCHRFEHSIELVLLILKWKFPTTPFSIIPILCGS